MARIPEPSHLADASDADLAQQLAEIASRLRPIEAQLAELRGEREVLLTEVRRRERGERVTARRDLRTAAKSGALLSLLDLVAQGTGEDGPGDFADFDFSLATGGEVKLGFPAARQATIVLTDGSSLAQARNLAEAHRFYMAGWEFGAAGKPGVRVHFPGTRLERLVPADQVFARRRGSADGDDPGASAAGSP